MLDLNLLYTFLEVVRSKNLNIAAQKLYVTPSALSQRIKTLETQMGSSLFHRKRTGMELNSFGRQLLRICSPLEINIKEMENWMMAQRGEVAGELSIVSISTFPNYIFPDFMGGFLKRYPKVSVKITTQISQVCEEVVLSGAADLGVIAGKCQKPSLKMKRLIENNNVLMVCSKEYFLARKKHITQDNLRRAQIIWHGNSQSRTLKVICEKWDIPFHTMMNALSLPSMEACKQHALRHIGIAFISKMCIYDELKSGKLVAIPGLNMVRPAYLISRNERHEALCVTKFKAEFTEYCRKIDERWK